MIVLIGANCFLAKHLCEFLERSGRTTVVVSRKHDRRFLDRFAPSLRRMEATEFASASGHALIAQARALVYFTWRSVPGTSVAEPLREVTDNVEPAFEFFLRVSAISQRAKIVFISSGGTVYARDGCDPKSETSPTGPISAYGLGKLMAEEALSFVGRTRGLPYAILRISNAVGRWQTSELQGIVGVALRAARDGVPVRLYGGGTQVRDFVDADDVAEAIAAASADTDHPAAVWNIGSGVGTTISDLIGRISELIGRPIATEQAPARSVDVPHIVLDCRKAARELGWAADTPIEQSITSAWEAIRNA